MFDIGWQELFLIFIVAVVVLGPKDLPVAIRTITRMVRKLRGMAGEFQRSMDEVIREAELDEIRDEIRKASDMDVGKAIEKTIDPTGSITRELDMSDLRNDLEGAARPPSLTQQPAPAPASPGQVEAGAPPALEAPVAAPAPDGPAAEAPVKEEPAKQAPDEAAQRRSAG